MTSTNPVVANAMARNAAYDDKAESKVEAELGRLVAERKRLEAERSSLQKKVEALRGKFDALADKAIAAGSSTMERHIKFETPKPPERW